MQTVDTITYFGSFNPIHSGHISIAEYVIGQGLCGDVMLVVSPQNPFKEQSGLAPFERRLEMATMAAAVSRYPDQIKVSDIEGGLPLPSRTITTLRKLSSMYPGRRFGLLIGEDNVDGFDRWYEYEEIIKEYTIYVYPREGCIRSDKPYTAGFNYLSGAPLWSCKATDFREGGECGLPEGVYEYIVKNKLYGRSGDTNELISELSRAIGSSPSDHNLYIERGKAYYKAGLYGQAMNDFLKVRELDSDNGEAESYIEMIKEIFEFRNLDMYNP